MARNGSGTYSLYTPGNPVVTGTTISSTAFNNTMNDLATALTLSIASDGQTPITANIPMASHKITGLAAGTTAGDALMYGQSGAMVASLSITAGAIIAGTYTPTLTNDINITSSTAYACQYMRVGNVVTVSGTVGIRPTASTTSSLISLSLPIASTFGGSYQCGGLARQVTEPSDTSTGGFVAGATKADLVFYSSYSGTSRDWTFSFTYQIV